MNLGLSFSRDLSSVSSLCQQLQLSGRALASSSRGCGFDIQCMLGSFSSSFIPLTQLIEWRHGPILAVSTLLYTTQELESSGQRDSNHVSPVSEATALPVVPQPTFGIFFCPHTVCLATSKEMQPLSTFQLEKNLEWLPSVLVSWAEADGQQSNYACSLIVSTITPYLKD